MIMGPRFVPALPRAVALLLAVTTVAPASAQTLVAARAIARGEVIAPEALAMRPAPPPPGALSAPGDAIGRTARRALAPGTPIRADALAAPLAVRRGEAVTLRAQVGAARIEAAGIAEADASAGALVPVRNVATGARLRGRVSQAGVISIGP